MTYLKYSICIMINCLGYLTIGILGQLEFSWLIWFVYILLQCLIYKAFYGDQVEKTVYN